MWVVPRPVMASTTAALRSWLPEQFGDAAEAVARTGGGLGGLHEDDAGFELERGLDGVQREGLAVGRGDEIDLAAEGLGEAGPALAELAGGENQHAVAGRGEVGDGGLHGAGPELERTMTSLVVPTKSLSCASTRL